MTIEQTHPIVVGVEGTARSAGALRYAVTEAVRRGVGLSVVHVTPGSLPVSVEVPELMGEIETTARAVTDDARAEVERIAPGLPVTTYVASGSVSSRLVELGQDAAEVIVGHEGKGLVERVITGATTAAVAARADAPVVVVPSDWTADGPSDGRVVVGIRRPGHLDEVLRVAFERAAGIGGSVEVVHAWQLPDPYADLVDVRTHAESWLAEGRRLIEEEILPWRRAYPQVDVTVTVVHGDPVDVLLWKAAGADLFVLLRRGKGLLGPHLGRTARAVLASATSPVQVVPRSDVVVAGPDLELERAGELLR